MKTKVVPAVILLLLGQVSVCSARELFYFLAGNSVRAHSSDGELQAIFPLPPIGPDSKLIGLSTDGITAWFSKGSDSGYTILGHPLRPGGVSKSFPVDTVPHYFLGGMAQAGDTLFLGRHRHPNYVTELYKIERYSATSGAFLGSCFASFWPVDMQYANGRLVVAADDRVYIYENGCNVERHFQTGISPGAGITTVCANSSFIWIFKPVGDLIGTGLAFDWSGNRRADQDIVFDGLGISTSGYLAWGPDEPNIRVAPLGLYFGDLAEGLTQSMTVEIRNIGNLNLNVSSIALSDAVNYSLSGAGSAILSPGDQMNIPVVFQPQSVNTFEATLTITSNDPDQPSIVCNLSGQGRATVTYVDGDLPESGDGRTWETAFNSLSAALSSEAVVDNTEIWIKGRTYNISSEILVDKTVSLYAGFAGTETSRAERDCQANPTILDAGGACRCMQVTAAGSIVIDGFTFRNGHIEYPEYYGAGLWLNNASLNADIKNCAFENCVTGYQGGGLHCSTVGSASVSDCLFDTCQSSNRGGGIYCKNNAAIQCCTVKNCSGEGGIFIDGNSQVSRCLILTNSNGGVNINGPAILRDSVIAGNSGWDAMRSGINTGWQNNCQIINCTLIDNGVWLEVGCSMTNSIVWEIGQEWTDIQNYGTIRYCAIGNTNFGTSVGQDANGNTRQYPMFADPDGPDNDPSTYQDNNYALAPGSPCVDAANGSVASAQDYLGNPRFDDPSRADTGTGSPAYIDIGAYECQIGTPSVLYVDPDATGAGTGLSWADATTDIPSALQIVPLDKNIYIKEGIYTSLPLVLTRNCSLYGGFAGHESSPEERDIQAHPTVLDGAGVNQGISLNKLSLTVDGITCKDCLNGISATNGSHVTVRNCRFEGGTSTAVGSGIFIYGNLSVSDCQLFENRIAAISVNSGYLSMTNTLVAGNFGPGVSVKWPTNPSLVENCTIVDNLGVGVEHLFGSTSIDLRNCMLRGNTNTVSIQGGTIKVEYCNLDAGDFGITNINTDPLFAQSGVWDDNGTAGDTSDDTYSAGDYHVQSEFGRWDPIAQAWTTDMQTSPCIDAGHPADNWENEPWPSGRRINMGCYGGTIQASMSGPITPDLTLDGWIDERDVEIVSFSWLCEDQTCDLYPPGGDGIIDLRDFAVISENYHPEPEPIIIDFETGNFDPDQTWSTGGTPGWSVVAVNMSPENQYQATSATGTVPKYTNSWLRLTIDTGALDTIQFDYYINNPSNQLKGYFSIDGVQICELTSKNWITYGQSITPGLHTFEWKSQTWFSDLAESLRLDNIKFLAAPSQP
ncbi:MAG: right-handed parallel beta-helix repeat-containing protein [Sedimentisphaerales bacterium]|nr:right-handed parallel beta-helix repeat-containing protein [Sedimentisphaerales bacterium]